jgi:hypothetical protein
MSVGLDPHTNRDQWWVYDYFPETIGIDRARFTPMRIVRGEMVEAGFAWTESLEAHHLESQRTLREAFPNGIDRRFTSQLTVLTDEEFARGLAQIDAAAAANGGDLVLAADLRFYATTGWLG